MDIHIILFVYLSVAHSNAQLPVLTLIEAIFRNLQLLVFKVELALLYWLILNL